MHTLSTRGFHALRLAILENAAALQREAAVLLQHGMHSRAYLLAHLCFEELGKLVIVFGAVAQLERGEAVDWKNVKKSFSNHIDKIGSQNGHLYAFGRWANDGGLDWLVAANKAVPESYRKKNLATYVDVSDGNLLRPEQSIAPADAEKLVALASECVHAHERSEGLTNPILYEAEEQLHRGGGG